MTNSVNSEANETAHNYCINKAIPDGSNLYYATIFDNAKSKIIIISLHAFLHELTDIIYECSDPGVAQIKLGWWQEEIERLFNHQARHPVTRQLQECITLEQHLKPVLYSIIDCFEQFIFIEQPDSINTVLSLYKSTVGEVWYQCGLQLNLTKTDVLEIMREMGALIHFMNCLQQPKTYINEMRCIIPVTYISKTDLLNLRTNTAHKHSKQNEIFSPLILDIKTRLDKTYNELNRKENKMFQHGLILNRLVYKTCDEILKDGCHLLDRNVRLTPLRKIWIAGWTHFYLK